MKRLITLLAVLFFLIGSAYAQVDSGRVKDSGKLNRKPLDRNGSHPDSINAERKMPPKKNTEGTMNGSATPLGKDPDPKRITWE